MSGSALKFHARPALGSGLASERCAAATPVPAEQLRGGCGRPTHVQSWPWAGVAGSGRAPGGVTVTRVPEPQSGRRVGSGPRVTWAASVPADRPSARVVGDPRGGACPPPRGPGARSRENGGSGAPGRWGDAVLGRGAKLVEGAPSPDPLLLPGRCPFHGGLGLRRLPLRRAGPDGSQGRSEPPSLAAVAVVPGRAGPSSHPEMSPGAAGPQATALCTVPVHSLRWTSAPRSFTASGG